MARAWARTRREVVPDSRHRTTGTRHTYSLSMPASSQQRERSGSPRRWSARVMATSDALDLEDGVFKKANAHAIAVSLKRSAERSRRRKSGAYRSAMSMLTFFINRAGERLPQRRRAVLERAKDELRTL